MKTQQAKCKNVSKIKHTIKLKRLKELLANKLQEKPSKQQVKEPFSLRNKMMMHLRASRFRFINETLYSNESAQSKQYFKEDPIAFKAYHKGYKQQLEQWPINPLDVIISSIKQL